MNDETHPATTAAATSKAVLLTAARLLIDSKDDLDFAMAEAMLRSILMERASAVVTAQVLRRPYRLPKRSMA